jgi:hypothetical protein
MPKICKRRGGQTNDDKPNMTARKVSFEDGSSSQCSSFEFEAPPLSPKYRPLLVQPTSFFKEADGGVLKSSKILLRRRTPSVCLADLAQDQEPISPKRSSTTIVEESNSPWGHFIDVIPQHDEDVHFKVQTFSLQSMSRRTRSNEPYRLERRRPAASPHSCYSWEFEGALEQLHL